jgi:alpha-1,3-mannosyl-glycoprotein beta-1,2-N-acetylglucosaminyltransferase
VLRPEVCRTYHFATHGTSNNEFKDFLTSIRLNEEAVPWRTMDLSTLARPAYDAALAQELARSPLVSADDARAGRFPSGDKDDAVRVEYLSVARFEPMARRLGIMDNVKAGVPRGAYHGVVTVRISGRKVHVSPPLRDVKLT